MRKKNITTYTLINMYDINPRTINNQKHNKSITMFTLEKLCKLLDAQSSDIVKFIDKDK